MIGVVFDQVDFVELIGFVWEYVCINCNFVIVLKVCFVLFVFNFNSKEKYLQLLDIIINVVCKLDWQIILCGVQCLSKVFDELYQ